MRSRSRSATTSSSLSRLPMDSVGIAEVRAAVELAEVPGRLAPHAVVGAHEIPVGDGHGGLLDLPQVVGVAGGGGGGHEHDLRAVQPEHAAALGKVAVVADVDADGGVAGLEDGISQVPGLEVELLPERGQAVRDVVLAVLAEVRAVGVEDGRGVVVDAGRFFLVDGHHHGHLVLPGQVLHQPDGGTVGYLLGEVVPARVLLRGEVRTVEQLLEAQHLHAAPARLVDHAHVLGDHGLAHVGQAGLVGREDVAGLDESGADDTRHRGIRSQRAMTAGNRNRRPGRALRHPVPVPFPTIRGTSVSGLDGPDPRCPYAASIAPAAAASTGRENR